MAAHGDSPICVVCGTYSTSVTCAQCTPAPVSGDAGKVGQDDDASVYGKYGNCPVQIERTIGDRQFYFRARGEHWSLCVGDAGDMSECAAVDGEEILSGVIHVPFIAGWMPAKLAEALTDWGIDAWTRQQSGEFERKTREFMEALNAARAATGGEHDE